VTSVLDGTSRVEGNGASDADVLLVVQDLRKYFPIHRGILGRNVVQLRAVDGVSFRLQRGETLGLVGESGCGKSTTGRAILRLIEPTSGRVFFDGQDLREFDRDQFKQFRRRAQIVFQDPFGSLSPRLSVGQIVGEGLLIHGEKASYEEHRDMVSEALREVGLDPDTMDRYPHEFSGGQRQRIGIARALALNPSLIIADEPVSALDVSVQAQVINLFMDLQEEFGISYLFIAHDLAVVAQICHRIAVMYLGRLVELADRDTLFRNPVHPYTQALLASIPIPNPKIKPTTERIIHGDIPSPSNPPKGCRFHTRCPLAEHRCRVETPEFKEIETGHWAACHLQN